MAYLLDANIFIQAKNLHYGFDFCPGFWHWLIQANDIGRLYSLRAVADELIAGDDELSTWSQNRHGGFFLETDQMTLPALAEVSRWVQDQDYEPAAINTFLQVADYYLIAYAKAHGHTVVTHEVPSDSRRKIKIPAVCIGMDVEYVGPYAMLRREGVRLILGNTAE